MIVVDNIGSLATMAGGTGIVNNARVVMDGDRIVYAGPALGFVVPEHAHVIDAGGRAVIPGLVDCHSHSIFAGDRADEFARRANGESYVDIAKAGGGIKATMRAVRDSSVERLVELARPRLRSMLARGVTTLEVKSGYGLTVADEVKMLDAARALNDTQPIAVAATLLAAHAVPPEFADAKAWVDVIIAELLPIVQREGLATCCDVFVEQGAFSVDDARRLLRAGAERGLAPVVHAEQMSHQGGAMLAAEVKALRAGHLEYVTAADIDALAKAGVVAEILSTAQVFLRGQKNIPARAMIDGGCTVAIGTDFNPGTAMCADLPLAAGLAVTQCDVTADEALIAVTAGSAQALGLRDRGRLCVGMRADVVILDADTPYSILYQWSAPLAHRVFVAGESVYP